MKYANTSKSCYNHFYYFNYQPLGAFEMNIGKIKRIPIRDVFKHEASHFSKWLADNIGALSDELEIEFSDVQREERVGSFRADIFCKDSEGRNVIIENQLEDSNHDHLGKLLTYMVDLEAETAIWIATEANKQHRAAVKWLNQSTRQNMRFYLVKVEALLLGNTHAPLFTILEKPTEDNRKIGAKKEQETLQIRENRAELYRKFWDNLLKRSKEKTKFGSDRKSTPAHFFTIAIGRSNVYYAYTFSSNGYGVFLNLETGNYDKNKALFDSLYAQKSHIESIFGNVLDWRRLDNRSVSTVNYIKTIADVYDRFQWNRVADEMIDMMIQLDKAFHPHLKR